MLPQLTKEPRRSVLIVEQSDDSREVLRTVLERRGTEIFEADEAHRGLEIACRHHPAVIVLDLETDAAGDEAVQQQFGAEAAAHDSALVVLGKLRRRVLPNSRQTALAKPYHYAPLVRKIEELLESAET